MAMLVDFSSFPKPVRNRAQRRLSYVTAETAAKVLRHDRYWSVPFLCLFLDACRRWSLDSPARSLALARQGLALVERVRIGPRCGEIESEPQRRSWRLLACAIWSEAARVSGCLEEATAAVERGLGIAAGGRADVRALAQLELARAALAYELSDPSALEILDRAIELGRRAGPPELLAEALLLRSAARTAEGGAVAMEDAAEAAVWAGPKGHRAERVFDLALTFVRGWALCATATADEHRRAAGQLHRARRRHYTQTVKSVRKMRLFHTEALIVGRLGITRMAIRRLERLIEAFDDLGETGAMAECGIELALLYLDEESPSAAHAALVDMARRLREAGGGSLDRRNGSLEGCTLASHDLDDLERTLAVLPRESAAPSRDSMLALRQQILARRRLPEVPAALIPPGLVPEPFGPEAGVPSTDPAVERVAVDRAIETVRTVELPVSMEPGETATLPGGAARSGGTECPCGGFLCDDCKADGGQYDESQFDDCRGGWAMPEIAAAPWVGW